MTRDDTRPTDRPEIIAATRGGDVSLRMATEPDPAHATLEQALFWHRIYTEILAMEEVILERIYQLQALQSAEARQEIDRTNVPVIVSQVERFRSRLGFWQSRIEEQQ